jgi:ADP-ribose pyrophosphatase
MESEDRMAFDGRQFRVYTRDVATPRGVRRIEWVERTPAVAVLAEDAGRLVAIRQYRPAVGETLWEIPAGRIDAGESGEAAARRELAEETGYRGVTCREVFRWYPSPGYTTEELTLYYMPDAVAGPAQPEPDEEIAVVLLTRAEVRELLQAGAIRNGPLLIAVLWWLGPFAGPAGRR